MSKVASDRLGGRKTLKVSGFLDEFEKDEIKDKVDIVSLFASFGVELTKKGSSYIGLCPFHDDHNPSLSVDQGKGLFNCFGCGASGDVFDVVERIKGTDFKGSLKYLKEWILGKATTNQKPTAKKKNGQKTNIPSGTHGRAGAKGTDQPPPLETGKQTVGLEDVARHYEARLAQNREAMDYLKKRGVHDTRIWNRFFIGYCDGALIEKLSADQITTLKTSGIINQKTSEHFKNCIVVPLYDETKRIVGFYGRRITDREPVHLYLPGGHKGLMNRESAAVYRDGIILTESVIDALSLLQTGIENVIPCYGVNGFTEEHLKLLKENRVEEIIIAFDADDSGKTGAEKLSSKLVDDGFKVKVIDPAITSILKDRGCKDWNDTLLAGVTKDEIKKVIDEAPVQLNEQSEKLFTVEKDGPCYQFLFADLSYRILGAKETFVSSLRVNVRVERNEDVKKYLDNVDLYSARSRGAFALSASVHFSLETSRIERDLLLIVDHLEEERDKALSLEPKEDYVLSPAEEAAGMELLQSPDLIGRIIADTETLGYVGEDTNKLLLYIAASTRKLADPLSVIVISESAAGKSYLIDTVKKLMPPEDVVSMTSLSDQALNYLPENG
ncbi:MAG: toprim domain-containing protein, partial [Kosmotogaceae bacterium]|nr:toprim domain-containing protein [Kosmotogaceae bacterium]